MQVVTMWGQQKDRIANHLTGAMVGHVPTAPGGHNRNVTRRQDIRRGSPCTTNREDGIVLTDQQGVRDVPSDPVLEAGRHPIHGLDIAYPADLLDLQAGSGGSVSSSAWTWPTIRP